MAWIYGNRYLSQSEMENNAKIVYSYLSGKGWSINAIAGILGNMETESTINPAIWQNLDSGNTSLGYGLVQWTPSTNYTDWAESKGYDITNGDYQLQWINEETVTHGQWYATDDYNISFSEFKTSTKSAEWLAGAFLKNFERAGSEVLSERQAQGKSWYTFLVNLNTYTPRLSSDGMEGSKYYYSDNIFYLSGYGLPNCTCYAWGRRYEITGEKPDYLSTGDAREWYPHAVVSGSKVGQTPKLGAIICISYEPSGHVAVVEKINSDGSIVISQSAYGGTYFWTEVLKKEDGYLPSWAKDKEGATVQGFIYLPTDPVIPSPEPIIFKKKKGFNFILFNRRRTPSLWKNRKY